MPVWLAAMKVSRLLRMPSAVFAPALPCATAASSCVARTFTIEYSNATKSPLKMTSRNAPPSASHSPIGLEQRLELGIALQRIEHGIGGEPPRHLRAIDRDRLLEVRERILPAI